MMDAGPFPASHHAAHDLTKVPGFALGPLSVDPPSRRVSAGARGAMLEPRVMRVLVALGAAGGGVLSRDDLIEQCWDGTVVGDKAIDRAIALLRHALDDLTCGAVKLETITKVGFRLFADAPSPGAAPAGGPHSSEAQPVAASAGVPVWRRTWTRRATVAGLAGAGGAAALGYAAWLRTKQYVPDPRAAELYRRGQAIQKAGVAESIGEAIDAYKQAVVIDPRYADAWGALALSYCYLTLGGPRRTSDPRELRVAAGRALALDPDNADARLALIGVYPVFRHWLEWVERLRAFLGDHPASALGHAMLA